MEEKPVLLIDFDETMRITGGYQADDIFQKMKEIALEQNFTEEEFQLTFDNCKEMQHNGLFNCALVLMDYDKEKFDNYCEEVFKRMSYEEVEPAPELYDLLLEISKYYDIYCATNNHMIHLDLGFKKMFGKGVNEIPFIKPIDIVGTEKYGRFWGKQTPHAFDIIIEKIGRDISQCTLLDDSILNIRQAKSIGMNAVEISERYPLIKHLKKLLDEKRKTTTPK